MSRQEIFAAIDEERIKQDAKWGQQDHDDLLWGAILAEEVGEAAQAALFSKYNPCDMHTNGLRQELTQAAAVIVAWLEAINRRQAVAVAP